MTKLVRCIFHGETSPKFKILVSKRERKRKLLFLKIPFAHLFELHYEMKVLSQ